VRPQDKSNRLRKGLRHAGGAEPKEPDVSKKFLTDVIAGSAEMPASQAGRVAADVIAAIKREIIETGRFTLPDFGSFAVRETKARTGLNPRTGEKVKVKAGATVRFKASPNLKEAALAGMKKAKRKAAKA
jgi:DNA-binding protein HU-beta